MNTTEMLLQERTPMELCHRFGTPKVLTSTRYINKAVSL